MHVPVNGKTVELPAADAPRVTIAMGDALETGGGC